VKLVKRTYNFGLWLVIVKLVGPILKFWMSGMNI